jgi:F420-dependent oxidoreductase-like protein
MRFAFWPGAGNPWQDTLVLGRHAEATGWGGIYYADHFMPNAADTSGPTSECWTTLAGLAAAVPRVRIGALVTGNTYRHPAVLAKMVANIDNISGGRAVLGLGAGWQENEHHAYGIEFSTLGGRMRRLDEACQVVKGLFSNEKTTFAGRYYQLTDAPLAPKPVQSPLPLLIGGGGEKKTLLITAKYADDWNVWGLPSVLTQKMAVLDAHCKEIGRDPKHIGRSAVALLALTDDPAVAERTRGSGRPVIGGNAAEVASTIQEYVNIGVGEVIIPDFNLGRTVDEKKAAMDRFATEVMAKFR